MAKSASQILEIALGKYGTKEYRANIITPERVKIGNIGDNVAYEVTKGEGFEHNTVYGVTICRLNSLGKAVYIKGFSKMCESMDEVNEHLAYVRTQRTLVNS